MRLIRNMINYLLDISDLLRHFGGCSIGVNFERGFV
jgi:hypothetical protein